MCAYRRLVCAIVLATSTSSCGEPAAPTPSPTFLTVVSGDGQTAVIGLPLDEPLVVEVTDEDHRPLADVVVEWSAASGSLSVPTATTDQTGRAEVAWTLGTEAGQASLTATVSGLLPVTFMAEVRPGPAAALELTGPAAATAGEATTLTLTARDQHGNVATDYEGPGSVVFSGASPAPDGTLAVVWDTGGSAVPLGTTTSLAFAAGEATAEGTFYAAETAALTATDGTFTAAPFEVDVAPGAAVMLTLTPSLDSIFATFATTLSPAAADAWENPTIEPLTWTSSGTAASVDVEGTVTGVDSGSVTVTATTTADVQASAVIVVDRFVGIAAGGAQTCAVSATGRVYCWGDNSWGQLGDGTQEDRAVPTPVSGDRAWSEVKVGYDHACGLTRAGEAYCWGDNFFGQLGTGGVEPNRVPVLVSGGHEWAWLSVGTRVTCGISSGGDAYCWGAGGHGQRGDDSFESGVTTPSLVVGGHTWAQISAGTVVTCGVTTAGAGYCWGAGDYYGQLGTGSWERIAVPALISGGLEWLQLSAGWSHTCGVAAGLASYCWGNDEGGALGDGDRTTGSDVPSPVSSTEEWAAVSAGGVHSCGVTGAGAAFCWGSGGNGERGDGSRVSVVTVPSPVAGELAWADLHLGGAHGCGLTTAGGPYCWGGNGSGELGIGGSESSLLSSDIPLKITPP